jgi:hypothetical protein
MEAEAEYRARNIFEGAFLYCKGARLLTVEGTPGRSRFVFDNKDHYANNIAAEYVQDAPVPGKSLFEAFHQLKREADAIIGPIHPRTQFGA